MLNAKKQNKITLVIMAVLSIGIVSCLLGLKPEQTNKKVIKSSKQ